jgi:hypothetical protein
MPAVSSALLAGVGIADITPPLGTHLSGSGMGEHRPAQSIADPLFAKAIVFESGGKRVAIAALDLILITAEYTSMIRELAAGRYGLDPAAVMVHCTQTHSAPSFGHCMLDPDFPIDLPPDQEFVRGAETPYCRWAAERAVDAIGAAVENLRPVQMGLGRAERPDLAFNRRGEKTIDPEVGVMALRAEGGDLVSLLLHYSCHPVNLFCKGWQDKGAWHAVSADWCGVWADAMREAAGAGCRPIVINGSCGNINPGPYDDTWDRDHVRHGRALADTSRALLAGMRFDGVASRVDSRLRTIPLDYRQVPAERRERVEAILSASPQPVWVGPGKMDNDWFLAASTKSIDYCRRRMPRFEYEIQAFRVGDAAIVGLPGEPFSEGQLDLKRRSPAKQTFVAHMVSHYVGYLPAREVWDIPNHETNANCTYWAKLGKGSLERIVDTAVEMLGDLFPR